MPDVSAGATCPEANACDVPGYARDASKGYPQVPSLPALALIILYFCVQIDTSTISLLLIEIAAGTGFVILWPLQ